MNKWLLLFGAVFVVVSADDYFLRKRLKEAHRDAARVAEIASRTMQTNDKLFEVTTSCQQVLGSTIRKQRTVKLTEPEIKKLKRRVAEAMRMKTVKVATTNAPH